MVVRLFFVLSCIVFEFVNGYDKVLIGQSMLYGISYVAQNERNSTLCQRELTDFYESLGEQRVWALKVLDASGIPEPGFYYGNNLWLGSYGQCHDLTNTKKFEIDYDVVRHANATPYDYPPFDLGFFVAHLRHNSTLQQHMQLPLEFTVQIGLCVPKSCSSADLTPLIDSYLSSKFLNFQKLNNVDLELNLVRPVVPPGLWLLKLPKTIILLTFFSMVLLLAIVGTCYDVGQYPRTKNLITGHMGNFTGKQNTVSEVELVCNSSNQKTSTIGEILKCFSVYSNVRNLVKTDLPPDSVSVIHGLKFWGMMWVIMVHSAFYQVDYLNNISVAYRLSEDIFAQILSNSTYSVDTFLFLSGFLVGYLFFMSRKKNERSRRPESCLHKVSQFCFMFANRFFRLTPPYIFIILWTDFMYTYYARSSVLYSSERNGELCPKYWWRNLLYINNLWPRSEMCMSWSWYLSVDTQFFAVTTFLLILSTIMFKLSAALAILLILTNIFATAYKSYSIRYIPTMDDQLAQLDAIYDLPWNRIGPYLIGTITAYIYVVKLDRKLTLKKPIKVILSIVFPLLNLWILFTIYTRNVSVEFSAVYMGTSRVLWGVGLGWVVISCSTGNSRLIERFLSFPGWIPLSRLTYCAYLINPLMANMTYMGSNHSLNASKSSIGGVAQGIALSTYFIAFFFSILIESPSILLTKMMFNKLTKRKDRSNNNK